MHRKSVIGIGLLALVAWNTIWSGSLGMLVCLHDDHRLHIIAGGHGDECCEDEEPSSPAIEVLSSADKNCTDFRLEGEDLIVARGQVQMARLPIMAVADASPEVATGGVVTVLRSTTPVRGPPERLDASLRVARMIVLRV